MPTQTFKYLVFMNQSSTQNSMIPELYSYISPIQFSFQIFSHLADTYIKKQLRLYYTPCNVVRGNQNYANEILTGASGHELQSVDRMSTNLLSRYLQFSKRENRQFGNVVPNIVFISIQD